MNGIDVDYAEAKIDFMTAEKPTEKMINNRKKNRQKYSDFFSCNKQVVILPILVVSFIQLFIFLNQKTKRKHAKYRRKQRQLST